MFGHSAFILEFHIAFDIILICLTGDCFINKLKLRGHYKSYEIQSKLFITSLIITEYSISNIKMLGTDLFLLKFPLYNRIFT